MTEPTPLGPEAKAAIEAERLAPGLPLEARQQLRQRLWAALPLVPAAAAGGAAAGTGIPAAPAPLTGGRLLAALARRHGPLVAASLTMGGFGGAALQARIDRRADRPPAPLVAAPSAPLPAASSAPSVVQSAGPGAAALPAPAPRPTVQPAARLSPLRNEPRAAPEPPPAPATVAAATPPTLIETRFATADEELNAESMLIARARAALARGSPENALAALGELQTRFPQGQLVEDREALGVLALAQAARREEAQAKAEDFRRQYPNSWWMAQVEAAGKK